MHEAYEGPGAITSWIKKNNHTVSYSKVFQGDVVPTNCNNFDFLIIMGGPQSPYTTVEECPYFNSIAEQALIQNAVNMQKAVLGICLGAQIMSNAMGGKTTASPHTEIGLFEVNLNTAGQKDPLLADFPKSFFCGHWHGDMPGLSDDAVVLASTKGCPHQIIRFAPKAYAFQCHLEFTPDAIDDMISHFSHQLTNEENQMFIQSADQLRTNNYSASNQLLFNFLDKLVEA